MKLKREKTTGFREKNEQKKITGCCVVGAGDITARMRNEGGEVIPPPRKTGIQDPGQAGCKEHPGPTGAAGPARTRA